MKRLLMLLISIALFLTACTDSSASTTMGSTSPGSSTTAVAPGTTVDAITTTTSLISATTSTEASVTTTTSSPSLYPPDPFEESSDGAAGSGCRPGSEILPDGYWFGFMLGVGDGTVEFDLACFYFGDVAWEKAAEQGEEAPNDFWIGNENPATRTIDFEEDTVIWVIPPEIDGLVPMPFAVWTSADSVYTPCPGEGCSVWLEIADEAVTEVVEQYLP